MCTSVVHNLKNVEGYSNVYFTPDLTRNQRRVSFQLREDLVKEIWLFVGARSFSRNINHGERTTLMLPH